MYFKNSSIFIIFFSIFRARFENFIDVTDTIKFFRKKRTYRDHEKSVHDCDKSDNAEYR